MKKYTLWLLLLIPIYVAIVVRCTPSLHPIYTPDDIIYDPALIGTWQEQDSGDSGDVLEFVAFPEHGNAYKLTFTNGDRDTGNFLAHLAGVGDYMFLDLYPELKETDEVDLAMDWLIGSHMFVLVEQIEPDLIIRDMDYEWLSSYLSENPDVLEHEFVVDPYTEVHSDPNNRLVLTASPEELQAFMIEHLDTEGAYAEPTVYTRIDETSAPVEEEIPPG